MGTIYLVFGLATMIIGGLLFSRNALKRALRQRKTYAVIEMLRQSQMAEKQ